jgi:hypothetical protein
MPPRRPRRWPRRIRIAAEALTVAVAAGALVLWC